MDFLLGKCWGNKWTLECEKLYQEGIEEGNTKLGVFSGAVNNILRVVFPITLGLQYAY